MREQRDKHLEDIFDLKLEALSTAISEIDEQAARLEMSTRDEDRRILRDLRKERDALRKRIMLENDNHVRVLHELDREAHLTRSNSSPFPPASLVWPISNEATSSREMSSSDSSS